MLLLTVLCVANVEITCLFVFRENSCLRAGVVCGSWMGVPKLQIYNTNHCRSSAFANLSKTMFSLLILIFLYVFDGEGRIQKLFRKSRAQGSTHGCVFWSVSTYLSHSSWKAEAVEEISVNGDYLVALEGYFRVLSRFRAAWRKVVLLVHLPNFITRACSFEMTGRSGEVIRTQGYLELQVQWTSYLLNVC